MKVLAVMGSPRKNGASFRVVSQIEQCLKKPGEVEFEYLFLSDVRLEICRGCGLCLSAGEDKCPLKDDRELIERKLLDSDGVIFASAVYANNMTALMKNFMDRFAFTMHRPRFFKQYTLIVSVSRGSGLKETIAGISAIKYCGFNIVNSLGVAIYDFALVSENTKNKIHKKICAASNRFYKAIQMEKEYSPSLGNLVAFRAAQAVWPLLKKYQPCDYAYFEQQGWFDKRRRYYIDTKINPIKEWMAKVISALVCRYVRREIKGLQNPEK